MMRISSGARYAHHWYSRYITITYLPLWQQWHHFLLELFGNLLDGAAGIEYLEAVFLRHIVELLEQAGLVVDEAIEQVFAEVHVHAGFPVVEAAALQDTWYQIIYADAQVENSVGF
jgi:hypothetical protein